MVEEQCVKVKNYFGEWNRGIIIGDIHGCLHHLKGLLRKANFCNAVTRSYPSILEDDHDSNSLTNCAEISTESQDDLCIFVGDLVNKGPDSFGCVRLLKAIGAVGVLGNHDNKLVSLRKNKLVGGEESSLYTLARDCPHDVFEYLESLPHIIYFPKWSVIVVHGGLDPTLPLSSQSIDSVTRMRRLALKSEVKEEPIQLGSSEHFFAIEKTKIGKKWFKVWNKVMKGSLKEEVKCGEHFFRNSLVVYGHDAKTSLVVEKYTIGLDSGCVYGKKLTALSVPEKVLFHFE